MKMLIAIMTFFLINACPVKSFAQDQNGSTFQIPIERKITRLLNAERDLTLLPLDKMHIRTNILPMVELKKQELAPNYPLINGLNSDQKNTELSNWISTFSSEYDNYILYLETLIRSYL